jgi:hypothetical protein
MYQSKYKTCGNFADGRYLAKFNASSAASWSFVGHTLYGATGRNAESRPAIFTRRLSDTGG